MTNDEKVLKMYITRKIECPHIEANERVEQFCLNPAYPYYHDLLAMYNKRYGEENEFIN